MNFQSRILLKKQNFTKKFTHLFQSFSFFTHSLGLDPSNFVSFSLRFSTHDSTAPVFPDFFSSFVVVSLNNLNNLSQVLFVFVVDFMESNGGTLFSADQLTESGFAFDDAVWDVHFSAQSWKVDNDFDWINVVSNQNQLSLFPFDQVDNFVNTGGEHGSFLAWFIGFSFGSGFGSSDESSFFVSFGFWSVFGSQFENLSGVLLVQSLVELVD